MIKDLIIFVLLALLIYFIFFWKTKPTDSDKVLRLYDSLATLTDSIVVLNTESAEQKQKITQIQKEQEQKETEYKIADQRHRKKENARRAEIQHLIDSIPILHNYIQLRDSIDSFKDARIQALIEEKRIQRMAYEDLIKIDVAGLAVRDLALRNQRDIIQEKDKQLAREKRKKIWRTIRDVLIGGATVYTFDKIAELAN